MRQQLPLLNSLVCVLASLSRSRGKMRLPSFASTLHSRHPAPPGTFLRAHQRARGGAERVSCVGGSLQLLEYFVGVESKEFTIACLGSNPEQKAVLRAPCIRVMLAAEITNPPEFQGLTQWRRISCSSNSSVWKFLVGLSSMQ